MNIKEFLRSRTLLSVTGVEKECGIPHGTIRLNNDDPIPEKYVASLESLLTPYGYIGVNAAPIVSGGKQYFLRTVGKRDDKACAVFYKDDLFRRAFFPDGTHIAVLEAIEKVPEYVHMT